MRPTPIPAIYTEEITLAVLKLLVAGDDPHTFPWLHPPSPEQIVGALEELMYIKAVDETYKLTATGYILGSLGMEPIPAYFILLAYTYGSQFTREMSVYIAVMLDEVEYLFEAGVTYSSDIRRLASHYKHSQVGDHHKLGIILHKYLQQPVGRDRTDWALTKKLHVDVLNWAEINSK